MRPSMRFVLMRSEEYHTYSLLAVDFRHLLLAGYPAHQS